MYRAGDANLIVITAGELPDRHVLLGRKTRGPQSGLLVLPGGKIEPEIYPEDGYYSSVQTRDENGDLVNVNSLGRVVNAALREAHDETGIKIKRDELSILGKMWVSQTTGRMAAKRTIELFSAHYPAIFPLPVPKDTELINQWCPADEVPYQDMMPDMITWLPRVLQSPHIADLHVMASIQYTSKEAGRLVLSQAKCEFSYWDDRTSHQEILGYHGYELPAADEQPVPMP